MFLMKLKERLLLVVETIRESYQNRAKVARELRDELDCPTRDVRPCASKERRIVSIAANEREFESHLEIKQNIY